MVRSAALWFGILLAAVLAVYSNHFGNGFHFDDAHTIVYNPYIREPRYIPRFFTDARTFSILPRNRTYRPIVSASLALDYWLGKSYHPFWFHFSTFCWYLLQLLLMWRLFRIVCDAAIPDPRNQWVALLATAWYGLHPAMAETINYVIQRGDLYSALGVLAAVLVYAAAPRWRKYGLYLLPFAAGVLAKPPALIFPAILLVYIWLFEFDGQLRKLGRASLRIVPSLGATALLIWFTKAMTPKTFFPGAPSASGYRLTQPLVAWRFFRTLFIPDSLSADTDHVAVSSFWEGGAWAGFLFVAVVLVLAVAFSRKREWRPAAFGLWWFVLASLPASVFPVGEVENDHRMFFPYIGLVLAVIWPVALWVYKWPANRPSVSKALAVAFAGELAICAVATYQRNAVWKSEETLWRDVAIKSPLNGRGLMNYGLAITNRHDPQTALRLLNHATIYQPYYSRLEMNLGILHGMLKNPVEAERHFLRSLRLTAQDADGHVYFAHWLEEQGRSNEALEHLRTAMASNPDSLEAPYLTMDINAKQGHWDLVSSLANDLLLRFPSDLHAKSYRMMSAWERTGLASIPKDLQTADHFIDASALYFEAGSLDKCIAAAREAIRLEPKSPAAYNNIAAAYLKQDKRDLAAEAARAALKIKPDYESARRNLALAEKPSATPASPTLPPNLIP